MANAMVALLAFLQLASPTGGPSRSLPPGRQVLAVEAIAYSPEEGYGEGLAGFLAHRRLLWMNGMMDRDPAAMLEAIRAAEGYSPDIQEWMTEASWAQGALFRELMAVDFTLRTEFQIPVFFFAGRHDFNTPGQLVSEYIESIDAPAKGMVWFEEAGHSRPWEMPEAFRTRLAEVYREAVGEREIRGLPDSGPPPGC